MRLPVVPTLTVAVAVPAMIALGFWQLDRRVEKRAELAAFARPLAVTLACAHPRGPVRQTGGLGPGGAAGFAHRYECDGTTIDLGWSERPLEIALPAPGPLAGSRYIIPEKGTLLLVTRPAAPLLPSTPPGIDDIPNNHLSYAVQWFAFAATLAIIYAIFLRRAAPRLAL